MRIYEIPASVLVIGRSDLADQTALKIRGVEDVTVHRASDVDALVEARTGADLVVIVPGAREFPPCREVKASHRRFLPVMVILDPSATVSRAEVLHEGADDVLTGLPETKEMQLRVANWLRIKRAHDSLVAVHEDARQTMPPPRASSPVAPAGSNTRITMHGLIETRLRAEHARAQRHHEPLAFAYFSVDDAKHMLRRFGNHTVDLIAREIEQRMVACFREGDEVHRIDTLAFGVILPHTHFEGALAVTARAHKRVAGEYELADQSLHVSLSVGVSLFPSPRVTSYRELGSVAEQGASEALSAGGNRICVLQHAGYLLEP